MQFDLSPLHILVVEPSPAEGPGIGNVLREAGGGRTPPSLIEVAELGLALEVLRQRPVDVVLIDLALPDAYGLDAVEHLMTEVRDVPVVAVADEADETVAREALAAGAQDYLLRQELGGRALRRAIRNAIDRHRLLQRERSSRAAAEQARFLRDEFVAVVSHDLRAPLNAIALCAGGLADPTTDHAELGRTIRQATDWTRRIIRDLLDVAAIDRGQFTLVPAECDLCDIVREALALFRPIAESRQVALQASCPGGRIMAFVDPDRLQQAIDNLLENAVRATPPGGTITVAAARVTHDTGSITVTDTGCGIPPDAMADLFDRHRRAAPPERTPGLGLEIARSIVTLHGGTLSARSTVGEGSTFTITLPRLAS